MLNLELMMKAPTTAEDSGKVSTIQLLPSLSSFDVKRGSCHDDPFACRLPSQFIHHQEQHRSHQRSVPYTHLGSHTSSVTVVSRYKAHLPPLYINPPKWWPNSWQAYYQPFLDGYFFHPWILICKLSEFIAARWIWHFLFFFCGRPVWNAGDLCVQGTFFFHAGPLITK